MERFTGTQHRQGLQGRPILEESYVGLLEKTGMLHPPKLEPHNQMVHVIKRSPVARDGERSAAVVG